MPTHLTDTHFSDLPINGKVVDALAAANFSHCTPIQALALPPLLEGHDIAGQAQTGTGKTIAFLVATFHYLLSKAENADNSKSNGPRAIIMAPTRELAVQIYNDAKLLSEHTGLSLGLIYGGEGYQSQRETLEEGVDIIIGTTGRILDYYKQNLFRRMPPASERLSMLFSATLSYRVQELAYEHMNNPTHVQVAPEQTTATRVSQELFYPSDDDKMLLLLTLLEEEWPEKAIVFANTKNSCEKVTDWLTADGHRVGLLSGDVPQKKRLGILEDFTKGNLDILVATDVAARGLHIDAVTHVFNYDLPDDAEDYVHRIGRTGRAGQSGVAISFACEKYALNLPAIEQYIQKAIPVTDYDRSALLDDVTPPKPRRRRTPNNRNSSRRGNGRGRGKPQNRNNRAQQ